jgi:hypothetical protein
MAAPTMVVERRVIANSRKCNQYRSRGGAAGSGQASLPPLTAYDG